MNEALKALFDGIELSDETQAKIAEAFDAAVDAKVETRTAQIEEDTEAKYEQISKDYAEYVVEETQANADKWINEEFIPQATKYLDYATSEFMKENQQAVESNAKVELAESFLTGMAGIAESYNVKVPEGQDDLVAEMQKQVDSIQARFDKVLDEKTELEMQIVEGKKSVILADKLKGLTESQKEKIVKVSERVKFQDEEQFGSALEELVESYFPVTEGKDKFDESTEVEEEQEVITEQKSSYISRLTAQL